MKKILALTVLAALFSMTASGLTENLELHRGEQKSLNQYTLSYEEISSTPYFEVTRTSGDSEMILRQIENEKLLEMDEKRLEISDELEIIIQDVKTDEEGFYLDLKLVSPEDIFSDAELESSAPRKVFVEQGGEVTVPMTLENTGIVNQTFQLDAHHNSSMDISFSYRSFNITRLKVNTGETADISAEFDVPETAEPKIYKVELKADGRKSVSENITVDVRESQSQESRKEISIDADQSYVGIKPGEKKEIPVRVRNHGNAMLDNVEISISAPESWDTEISRKEVPGLEQYESFRSIITVEAPVNADTGDKFLEVSASSDDTSTEEPAKIRLTVQKESNLRYIGLGIMVLSLGSLIYVYRKLGRR